MSADKFTASDAMLGYMYQFRYGLCLALDRMRQNPDHSVSIELLDDIAFEGSKDQTTLVQTKHHENGSVAPTDMSVDVWKTLRAWSTLILERQLTPGTCVFVLITTGVAPEGSASSFLRSQHRDPDAALALLEGARLRSTNQELRPAFEAFGRLTEQQKLSLVHAIYVADGQPEVGDIRETLEDKLKLSVQRHLVTVLTERLEGWWFDQVVRSLSSAPRKSIPLFAIDQKLDELRDQFGSENLPIDYQNLLPTEELQTEFLSKQFVEQMRIVGANHQLVDAIKDYYRAFTQRNRWVSDSLLYIDDLENYDRRLTEAWEAQFHWMLDEMGQEAAEDEMQKRGRQLLKWVLDVPDNLYIKPECREPYVVRGNFHILADSLQIGWHPQFVERLSRVLEEVPT